MVVTCLYEKMAASVDSLKQQQFAKSAFGIPLKSSTFSRIQPPALHRISYLTGGLAELYEHIQNPNEEYNPNAVEASCITDEKGAFCPTKQVPLLAKRYHFIRILGKGCSATLIEAVDTFRPDSHHVAIKVLNEEYYALGYQESNNVERLNCADPQDFSGTVRLLNKFTFGNHFCLVFELLHPKPLHQYFKPISQGPKSQMERV
ncbi:putative dual specificity tyrosine-phosphorylation-regulated kinase 3 homolog isoform X2 [Asterias rubens]|uniref:putative dual specificity tyrosine-phosphorylation-regulated kinase 3 homolog isoform X2 n=1 Tax=Asterias rubens TaxID=7604 RepID=UPI00145597EE|nr:putative dual specificity tyrosine-phosphorylation-regulated kinase 3 homolog isoform X2 [Asterias rubens]